MSGSEDEDIVATENFLASINAENGNASANQASSNDAPAESGYNSERMPIDKSAPMTLGDFETFRKGEYQETKNKVDELIKKREEDSEKLSHACSLLSRINAKLKEIKSKAKHETEDVNRQIKELQECKKLVEEIMAKTNISLSNILQSITDQLKSKDGEILKAVKALLEATLSCAKDENNVMKKYQDLFIEYKTWRESQNHPETFDSLLSKEYLELKSNYVNLNSKYMKIIDDLLEKKKDQQLRDALTHFSDRLKKFDTMAEILLQKGILKQTSSEVYYSVQIEQLKTEKRQLQTELEDCKAQLSQLRQHVESSSAKESEYQINIERMQHKLEMADVKCKYQEKEITRLEQEVTKLEGKIKRLEDEIDSQKQEVNKYRDLLFTSERTANQQRREFDREKTEQAEVIADRDNTINLLNNDINSLRQENEELTRTNRALQTQLESFGGMWNVLASSLGGDASQIILELSNFERESFLIDDEDNYATVESFP